MKRRKLPITETPNPRTGRIDQVDALGIVDLINAEDALVAAAVGKERRRIAAGVEMVAACFRAGGRLFYVGAGTSGRLGVLDASECPPTFGSPPRQVQGIIAGGRRALVKSAEGAEDHPEGGAADIVKKNVSPKDVVVGIAACGLTPYVRGALAAARRRKAKTIFLTCSAETAADVKADLVINPVVGPEAVTGSTRMKAGTATKLVLNTLTTGAMIRLGKTYGNLMVDLRATNAKLRDRSERIVRQLTGRDRRSARRLLRSADGSVKLAVVMHFRNVDAAAARKLLNDADGVLRAVIE